MDMFTAAERKVADMHNSQHWAPPDAIAVAYFLFGEEMVVKGEFHHAYVELGGFYTRGQLVTERMNDDLPKNVRLIHQANATAFKKYVVKAAQATVVN